MQAIQVKYMGPTNRRGAEMRARCAAGTIRTAYSHGLSVRDNAAVAAMALVRDLQWDSAGYEQTWACGELADGSWAFASVGETFTPYFISSIVK